MTNLNPQAIQDASILETKLSEELQNKINRSFDDSQITNILQYVYPVGSIYMSVNDIDPTTLFGFGTWEKIKDTFLLSSGDNYQIGEMGGEVEHKLTYEELPATEGVIVMHNAALGTNIAGASGCFTEDSVVNGTYKNGGSALEASTKSVGKIKYSNGGKDVAHNNMPPYLVVNIWKRMS